MGASLETRLDAICNINKIEIRDRTTINNKNKHGPDGSKSMPIFAGSKNKINEQTRVLIPKTSTLVVLVFIFGTYQNHKYQTLLIARFNWLLFNFDLLGSSTAETNYGKVNDKIMWLELIGVVEPK